MHGSSDIRSALLTVLLNYSGLPVSSEFETRELQLQGLLGKVDHSVIRQAAQLAAKFVLYHELGHVHLKHFDTGQASRVVAAESEEISAFRSITIEFEANAFAREHLTDPNTSVTAAIVAKVAPAIYCRLLAMKEAMLPGTSGMSQSKRY